MSGPKKYPDFVFRYESGKEKPASLVKYEKWEYDNRDLLNKIETWDFYRRHPLGNKYSDKEIDDNINREIYLEVTGNKPPDDWKKYKDIGSALHKDFVFNQVLIGVPGDNWRAIENARKLGIPNSYRVEYDKGVQERAEAFAGEVMRDGVSGFLRTHPRWTKADLIKALDQHGIRFHKGYSTLYYDPLGQFYPDEHKNDPNPTTKFKAERRPYSIEEDFHLLESPLLLTRRKVQEYEKKGPDPIQNLPLMDLLANVVGPGPSMLPDSRTSIMEELGLEDLDEINELLRLADEGMHGFEKRADRHGYRIVYGPHKKSTRPDNKVMTFVSHDDRVIYFDKDLARKKYVDRAWLKPRVEGVRPLSDDQIPSFDAWIDFLHNHELSHLEHKRQPDESLADYENRVNEIAIKITQGHEGRESLVQNIKDTGDTLDARVEDAARDILPEQTPGPPRVGSADRKHVTKQYYEAKQKIVDRFKASDARMDASASQEKPRQGWYNPTMEELSRLRSMFRTPVVGFGSGGKVPRPGHTPLPPSDTDAMISDAYREAGLVERVSKPKMNTGTSGDNSEFLRYLAGLVGEKEQASQ